MSIRSAVSHIFILPHLFKEALRIYSVAMCIQIIDEIATNQQFSIPNRSMENNISSKHVKNISTTIFFVVFDMNYNKALLTPTKTINESKSQLSRPD